MNGCEESLATDGVDREIDLVEREALDHHQLDP